MTCEQVPDERYPEHAKMRAVKAESQRIGFFLEWLESGSRRIATDHKHTEECAPRRSPRDEPARECGMMANDDTSWCMPVLYTWEPPGRGDRIERILAAFYGIDLEKIQDEKERIYNDLVRAELAGGLPATWNGEGFWAGSDESITERVKEITASDAEHAAENIRGAIGHDESVTIHGFMALDAVAGLLRLAEVLRNARKSLAKPRKKATPAHDEDSREMKAARYLLTRIRANHPTTKEPNLKEWAADFDAIFRIDGRDPRQVAVVIDFAQSDDFWFRNILSPKSLRKNFDKVAAKMPKGPRSPQPEIEPKDL